MPNGIPTVRGPAIAREISQIGAPESPARRGGAGVLEALRETFALSPAAREIKLRGIERGRERQAVERERQIPVGPGASAALGLLFQAALTARGVPTEQAMQQAEEHTRDLTRGQIETVMDALGALVRQDPQGGDRARRLTVTLRGQLAAELGRLEDDIRGLEQVGVAGKPFTAEAQARLDQMVKERSEKRARLAAFDQINSALFGIPISGIRGAQPQPAGGRVQLREPAQPAAPPPPADVTGVEQEFLGGL